MGNYSFLEMLNKTWVIKIMLNLFFLIFTVSVLSQETDKHKNLVSFKDNGSSIIAKVGGKPVFQYNYKTQFPPKGKPDYYQRSGFIHPVFSPAGDTITEGFPNQHTHHHGVFSAWVNTTYNGKQIDFWNQQKQEGTVIFKDLISLKKRDTTAEIKAKHHHIAFINNDTIPILEEIWTITVYNSRNPFVWDIAIEQKNITEYPLLLNQYHYGGMAFRGRDQWNYKIPDNVNLEVEREYGIRTDEEKSRLESNHTQPKWVSMYGKEDNQSMSLTVHPFSNNANLPEFVRIHPEMPYFCFTPVVQEGFSLEPGEIFKTKYRIINSGYPPSTKDINFFVEKFP